MFVKWIWLHESYVYQVVLVHYFLSTLRVAEKETFVKGLNLMLILVIAYPYGVLYLWKTCLHARYL